MGSNSEEASKSQRQVANMSTIMIAQLGRRLQTLMTLSVLLFFFMSSSTTMNLRNTTSSGGGLQVLALTIFNKNDHNNNHDADEKTTRSTGKSDNDNPDPDSEIITEEMINMIINYPARGGSSNNNNYFNNPRNNPSVFTAKGERHRKRYKKKSSSNYDLLTETQRRRRRRLKSQGGGDGGEQEEQDQEENKKQYASSTQQHATFPRPVSVLIPGYGKAEGRRTGAIDIWKGIPYAAPPVGALRFAPPEAATPWAPSRLDASKFGPDCFQMADPLANPAADMKLMSEDCLYLNVFTPAAHTARSSGHRFVGGAKLLPVMVWLHGGGFQQGGARRQEYDGRRLAERDIIVVTINYRLGALGFLASSGDGIYGNFGLMDQRAAIDWVKKNIIAFGGDPDNITLFGESAGAVMIGLHLTMEGAGTLFHKAIMQSNPMGYRFRSVVIADFIGEALKRAVDCRDLDCLRSERVEELLKAQSSLMGVPRSVGDFFTWSPTLTKEMKMKMSLTRNDRFFSRYEEHRLPRLDTSQNSFVSEWRLGGDEITSDSARWSAVNVSQPIEMVDRIPDNIPVMIGSNEHEGEMFVHSAFPAPMPKAVYWMFAGALFRDSASGVLKHYRGLVDEVEREAEQLAKEQLEEEENKQEYIENKEEYDHEYRMLEAMNRTKERVRAEVIRGEQLQSVVNAWSSGGHMDPQEEDDNVGNSNSTTLPQQENEEEDEVIFQYEGERSRSGLAGRLKNMARAREEKRIAKFKKKKLKEAAKVVVDYRPVMSAIINDYLFRCPSWNFAHLLSEIREKRGKYENNVFVYHFSMPTHIPGYKECWGKACHTAELPYVFQSMDIIRSNYSTVGPFAEKEAPSAPEYPFTQLMADLEHFDEPDLDTNAESNSHGSVSNTLNHTKAFQRILSHFFGDYFTEDADEEMASDMAERWTSFARESNPNYDGSKAEWFPWRHKSGNATLFSSNIFRPEREDDGESWEEEEDASSWMTEAEYDYYSDFSDEHYLDETDFENSLEVDEFDDIGSSRSPSNRHYRRRALEALQMDVAEENVFKSLLRRTEYVSKSEDVGRKTLFGRNLNKLKKTTRPMTKGEAKDAVRLAQELGLMGMGIMGEGQINNPGSKPFFPEILELSWPPEGRLIERDCTCDFWDRIRYRY